MSANWDRLCEVQLLGKNGECVQLSDFKITFKMEWWNARTPKLLDLRIYNLSRATINKILDKTYTKIQLTAGYKGLNGDLGTSGMIFSGDIRFAYTGRDNPTTDIYMAIQALDGYEAYLHAFISTNLERGYTMEDAYHLLMRYLKPYGIVPGYRPEFPKTVYPRGRTFHGMVKDYLSEMAGALGAKWQFIDGQCNMMTKDMITHDPIVLNSKTGLVGMPQQTIGGGVNTFSLINPLMRINGLVHIDEASVYRMPLPYDVIANSDKGIETDVVNGNIVLDVPMQTPPASIAADGVYAIRGFIYTGDTRGQKWHMEMMCEARGANDINTESKF